MGMRWALVAIVAVGCGKGSGGRSRDAGSDTLRPPDGGDTAEIRCDGADAGEAPSANDANDATTQDLPGDAPTDAATETAAEASADSPVDTPSGADAASDVPGADTG